MRTALVAVAATTAIWSGSALGRTQPGEECNPADTLEGLNAPIEALIFKSVDHVPTTPDVSNISDINLEDATGDTGTPLLNLRPQVSEALREIFEADESTTNESVVPDVSTSTVADSDDVKNLSELNEEAAPIESALDEDELSLLRRQMYRIDI